MVCLICINKLSRRKQTQKETWVSFDKPGLITEGVLLLSMLFRDRLLIESLWDYIRGIFGFRYKTSHLIKD
jgi:hypothetical protein